jgi:hypothetical protein
MKNNKILIIYIISALLFINVITVSGSSDITLVSFVLKRTVLRPGAEIPIVARIWNSAITDTEVNFEIKLSDNLTLKSGSLKIKATMSQLAYTEVSWIALGPASGNVSAELYIIVGTGDTIKAQKNGIITDKYWTQKEFFLSAGHHQRMCK